LFDIDTHWLPDIRKDNITLKTSKGIG